MSNAEIPKDLSADQYGVVLGFNNIDPIWNIEIERAPDSSGSPDTANSEVIAVINGSRNIYVDQRASDSGPWHYRWRTTLPGCPSGAWSEWIARNPALIPEQFPDVPDVPEVLVLEWTSINVTNQQADARLSLFDPELRLNSVEYNKRPGGSSTFNGWTSWTPNSGTVGDNQSLIFEEVVDFHEKHNAQIKTRFTFDKKEGDGTRTRELQALTMDVDETAEARVMSVSVTDADELVVVVAADDDTDHVDLNVGDTSQIGITEPSDLDDPETTTTDTLDLDALGRSSATIFTGHTVPPGEQGVVKIQGVNVDHSTEAASNFGPVRQGSAGNPGTGSALALTPEARLREGARDADSIDVDAYVEAGSDVSNPDIRYRTRVAEAGMTGDWGSWTSIADGNLGSWIDNLVTNVARDGRFPRRLDVQFQDQAPANQPTTVASIPIPPKMEGVDDADGRIDTGIEPGGNYAPPGGGSTSSVGDYLDMSYEGGQNHFNTDAGPEHSGTSGTFWTYLDSSTLLSELDFETGDIISLSADVKSATGADRVRLEIEFYDSADTLLASHTSSSITSSSYTRTRAENITIPTNTSYIVAKAVNQDTTESASARRALVNRGPVAEEYEPPPIRRSRTGQIVEAGQVRNPNNDAGVLLSGTVPSAWNQYLNLDDSNKPFLQHGSLTLNQDGSADFSGTVSASEFTANTITQGDLTAEAIELNLTETFGTDSIPAVSLYEAGSLQGQVYGTNGVIGISSGAADTVENLIEISDNKILISTVENGENIEFNAGGDNVFTDGNVGIGTSTPTESLHTTGYLRADGGSPSAADVLKWNSTNNRYEPGAVTASPGGDDHDVQYNNGGTLAGANALQWDDGNGWLGVGGTPETTLHTIGGTVLFDKSGTIPDNSAIDSPPISLKGYYDSDSTTTTNSTGMVFNIRNFVDYNGSAGAHRLGFSNNSGVEMVTFDGDNERVGIGVTAPTAALDVSGDIVVSGTVDGTDISTHVGSSSAHHSKTTVGGNDGEVQYNNGGSFGGASTLHWDDVNSRLGIGITSPSQPLDVAGVIRAEEPGSSPSGSAVSFSSPGGNIGLVMFEGDGAGGSLQRWDVKVASSSFIIRDDDANNDPFVIEDGAPNNSIKVASGGNVGIGTASPQDILHMFSSQPTFFMENADLSGTDTFAIEWHSGEAEVRFQFWDSASSFTRTAFEVHREGDTEVKTGVGGTGTGGSGAVRNIVHHGTDAASAVGIEGTLHTENL